MFIEQYYINKKVCDDLVSFFKTSNPKKSGYVNHQNKSIIDKTVKNSIEISINPFSKEQVYINYIKELRIAVEKYKKKYNECNEGDAWGIFEKVNIQYYPPKGGFYLWHTERNNKKTAYRHLVFMTYLNDVTDEGETEWKYQKIKIQPKKGLTVIWPVDWTHTHRGIPSKTQDKYIITGWFKYV